MIRLLRERRCVSWFVAATLLCPVPVAEARLTDFPLEIETEFFTTVHRPTGCVAVLEYIGPTLIAAYIADPLCLPPGVEMQAIPFEPEDFAIPAAKRDRFRYP